MLSIEAFRLAGILSKTLAIGEKKKNISCVTKTLNIYHWNSASKQHSHSWLFSPSVGPSPSFFFVHQRPQQPEKLKIFFSYFTKYDATMMLCCHNKFVSFSISHCLVYESMIIENSRILFGLLFVVFFLLFLLLLQHNDEYFSSYLLNGNLGDYQVERSFKLFSTVTNRDEIQRKLNLKAQQINWKLFDPNISKEQHQETFWRNCDRFICDMNETRCWNSDETYFHEIKTKPPWYVLQNMSFLLLIFPLQLFTCATRFPLRSHGFVWIWKNGILCSFWYLTRNHSR